jgi:hypothetical protein
MSTTKFEAQLANLINYHSLENGSDTPDFMLSEYLLGCLEVYNKTMKAREKWYGREKVDTRLAEIEVLKAKGLLAMEGTVPLGPYYGDIPQVESTFDDTPNPAKDGEAIQNFCRASAEQIKEQVPNIEELSKKHLKDFNTDDNTMPWASSVAEETETMEEFMKREFGPIKPFTPHAFIDRENRCIEIVLEDVSSYNEWIKGEGADISLIRAMDGDRVVGARLPLKLTVNNFPVDIV